MHFIMCPHLSLRAPSAASLAAGGQGLHSPRHCLTGRALFSRHAPKDKIPPTLCGLAGLCSVCLLPRARLSQCQGGFALCCPSQKNIWIKNLFIQVDLYLFTSMLAMTCVFMTHLELRVAGGFGSPPQPPTRKCKCDFLVVSRGQGYD